MVALPGFGRAAGVAVALNRAVAGRGWAVRARSGQPALALAPRRLVAAAVA